MNSINAKYLIIKRRSFHPIPIDRIKSHDLHGQLIVSTLGVSMIDMLIDISLVVLHFRVKSDSSAKFVRRGKYFSYTNCSVTWLNDRCSGSACTFGAGPVTLA